MNAPRMSRAIAFPSALVLGCALLLASCSKNSAEAGQYHCPMHPTYVSDRPGDCPICGMRLVPVERVDGRRPEAEPSPTAASGIAPGKFLCPMHPEVGSDDPLFRCPECGMRLEPREDVLRNIEKPVTETPHSEVPVGLAPVDVTSEGARLAGVRTAPVEWGAVGRSVRTVGVVVPDETRVRHVHTKTAGWVERLHVNFTGQAVRAGQPILSLYSQELLATQEEFLRARESAARFAASQLPEVRRGGEDLLHAARRRLELFDVPASFIDELERSGRPQRAVTLLAPVSGSVTAKGVSEGQQVEPGTELFVITDLSRVWIEADFYEYEAGVLAPGQQATLTLPYDPTVTFTGRIAYVYPTLDPATRTLRARFETPNPTGDLKPGMFVNVDMALPGEEGLVIPDSAVIDSGERQIVFVAAGPGRFVPREVRAGRRSEGRIGIVSGLVVGEQVVVKANFLIDSESRLRAAIAALRDGAQAHGGGR